MRRIQPITSRKRDRRYWLRLLLVGLIGGVLLTCVGYEALYIESMTRPLPSTPCCLTPAELGLDYEHVTLTSRDGVQLVGWYIPSHNQAAIILLHGYGSNRAAMLLQGQMLGRHGYGVLLYDLRAHGESGGDKRTFGWLDAEDVQAALAFLQNRRDVDPTRIGIHGFSVGGQIAIRAAAQSGAIKAVVAEEPGFVKIEDAPLQLSLPDLISFLVNWIDYKGVELRTGVAAPPGIVDVIGSISPRPLYLISTGQDLGERLVKHFFDLAGEPKTLWQIPETYHGGAINARPAEYEERILRFFDEALLEE